MLQRTVFVFGLLLGLPAAAAAAPIAVGDVLYIKSTPETGGLGGGAFGIDLVATGNGVDYHSFCLQRTEYIEYGKPFTIGDISNAADDLPAGDPLSQETRWIYRSYRDGLLGAFAPDAIQAAIWKLEGEWASNWGNSATLILQAQAAVAGGFLDDRVRVLNLFYANGKAAQDQLMLMDPPVNAPEPGMLGLMGLALMGVARAARSRRRERPAGQK
jgi:hypothetical protein